MARASDEIVYFLASFVVTPSAHGATSCAGRPTLSALTWCLLQVPPKPDFYILLLLLAFLGSALGWPGSQSCSVQEVLRHYQAVIFQDLQAAMQWAGMGVQRTEPGSRHHRFIQKNLTGAGGGQGQPVTSCGAQKVWGRCPQTTICSLLRPLPHLPALAFLPFQLRRVASYCLLSPWVRPFLGVWLEYPTMH